jgi:hypothetical protein
MFALPGLIALLAYILGRPFDFVPALRSLPLLYVFFGLAVLGFVVDLAQHKIQWRPGIHLPWVVALLIWVCLTVLPRAPITLLTTGPKLLIALSLYFLIAHGVGSFRSFSMLAGLILASTVVVSIVCVHQSLQPFQCVGWDPEQDTLPLPTPDGRACENHADCVEDAPEPEWSYRCERVGVGGISTVGHGRVRYVGVLNDPNESALTVSLGMPIAIARYQRKRTRLRFLVVLATMLLAAATVVLSQSRGGQLVFLTSLGVYFLKRYRAKGVLVVLLLALPVLLLGGRGGTGAQDSTNERLICAMAGLKMFIHSPLIGVGFGQFLEHHRQTAHNSFVLAPAELGVVGMVLWGLIFWLSIKICWVGSKTATGPEAEEARTWGLALLACLCGMCAGILFLSFNYHFVLWTFFGMAGAYHTLVARHVPNWRLAIGPRDVAFVAAANLGLLAFLFAYIRAKGIT